MNLSLHMLATMGWLADESAAFRERILSMGRMVRFARGKVLYTVGDPPDAIFGIAAGHVDLSLPVAADEEVLIYRAGPGFWIGDSALLARTDRGLTITAVTDCDVFRLPGPVIRAHLAGTPDDWPALFRLNHRNTMLSVSIFAELLSLPPAARFARTLLRVADPDGVVNATQEDLARLTGMSRASVRRAMADLVRSGVIQTGYGEMRIVDEGRLREEAAL